jgi:hypothetical protein
VPAGSTPPYPGQRSRAESRVLPILEPSVDVPFVGDDSDDLHGFIAGAATADGDEFSGVRDPGHPMSATLALVPPANAVVGLGRTNPLVVFRLELAKRRELSIATPVPRMAASHKLAQPEREHSDDKGDAVDRGATRKSQSSEGGGRGD